MRPRLGASVTTATTAANPDGNVQKKQGQKYEYDKEECVAERMHFGK